MNDYMLLIIKTYRYAKHLLRIAGEAETGNADSHYIKSLSIKEIEEIHKFVEDLEAHGILDKIQEIAN